MKQLQIQIKMFYNSTAFEESIKLNNDLTSKKLFELEAKIISSTTSEVLSADAVENITYRVEEENSGSRYIVSIEEEIMRLLTTPLGSRVMRPNYGSELYKVRDREMNGYWLLMAIKYTFVAINKHIKRVRCRKVKFEQQGDGRLKMKLELEKR